MLCGARGKADEQGADNPPCGAHRHDAHEAESEGEGGHQLRNPRNPGKEPAEETHEERGEQRQLQSDEDDEDPTHASPPWVFFHRAFARTTSLRKATFAGEERDRRRTSATVRVQIRGQSLASRGATTNTEVLRGAADAAARDASAPTARSFRWVGELASASD
jgi:hypothetical protein